MLLPVIQLFWAILLAFLGYIIGKTGITTGILLAGCPVIIALLVSLLRFPDRTLWAALTVGFLSFGVARYVDLPWGLMLDFFLVIGWIGLVFKPGKKGFWLPLKNDIMILSLCWYGMLVVELFNPEMRSIEAWFYAMRGAGLYQLLAFGLTFMTMDNPRYMDRFLRFFAIFSIIGLLWGLRQMIFGTDYAEDKWLFEDGYAMTHLLAGVLRVFSFYSDAGQFGASQAMLMLVFGILSLGPYSNKVRILYALVAITGLVGFGISGTRGALAVPAIGFLVYLFFSKNFKLLAAGMVVLGLTFYFLKYTSVLQNVQQVRRMRTALNPNDASFQVRLHNQITFGNYLSTRPIGAGVGSAGFWGHRFSPGTLLAETATDSYYVKVWAETGIVGLSLHLFMFGYFVGKGGRICWRLQNKGLRQKILALYAAMVGIFMASYGNQVFSQMPTGILMYMAIPFLFMAEKWDKMENP